MRIDIPEHPRIREVRAYRLVIQEYYIVARLVPGNSMSEDKLMASYGISTLELVIDIALPRAHAETAAHVSPGQQIGLSHWTVPCAPKVFGGMRSLQYLHNIF